MQVMPTQSTAIIAGCTGTLGPQITEELRGRGVQVYGGSRSPGTEFQYSNAQLRDSAYWYDIISQYAATSNTVLLVNTIGQATVSPDSTFEHVNVLPVVALAEAGKRFAEDHPDIKVVVVQVSAIAATYLHNDAYGDSRAEADRRVVALGTDHPLDNYKTLALQLPFVFVEPKEDPDQPGHYTISGLHHWSMEQIAGLPIVPLAGSGEQVLYPVSVRDVTVSIANAVDITESRAIEVKGGTGITQRGLIDFYARMNNRNILYVPLPSGLLGTLLDEFPYGLLSGFAPKVMHELPTEDTREEVEPFDALLGRKAQGIEEAHTVLDAENVTVTLAPPPIREHLSAHKSKLAKITGLALGAIALVGGSILYATSKKIITS